MPIKNPNHKAILKSLKKIQKDTRKTVQWGMNDAAAQYKKTVPDLLRERYTIKIGAVNARVKVIKAKAKDTEAKVEVYKINREKGESTPPSYFSFKAPKVLKGGVQIEAIKGKRSVVKGAFIRTIGGNKVIMRRKDPTQKAAYPTAGVHAPSPGGMLEKLQGKNAATIDKIVDKTSKNIFSEILK